MVDESIFKNFYQFISFPHQIFHIFPLFKNFVLLKKNIFRWENFRTFYRYPSYFFHRIRKQICCHLIKSFSTFSNSEASALVQLTSDREKRARSERKVGYIADHHFHFLPPSSAKGTSQKMKGFSREKY